MEPLTIAAVVALLIGGRAWVKRSGRRTTMRLWRGAATARGMEVRIEEAPFLGPPHLVAVTGSLSVHFEECGTDGDPGTRLIVENVDAFERITLRPEGLRAFVGTNLLGSGGVKTGDAAFDRAFIIDGAPAPVFASLDAETRRRLLDLRRQGHVEITNGALRVTVAEAGTESLPFEQLLPSRLELALECARPLSDLENIEARLAGNARNDPRRDVRWNNLRLLMHEFPDDAWTRAAIAAAREDVDDAIRLEAAIASGAEGRSLLLKFARQRGHVAARAVSALDDGVPVESVLELLAQAPEQRDPATLCACMGLLGRIGGPQAVERLIAALSNDTDGVAAAAAEALETASAGPQAEPSLIAALARAGLEVRVAAARALGRMGSISAVLPLTDSADRFIEPHFRKVAREAVAQIQSRVDGASPGQLSIAATDAGRLSMADAGQLSVADAEGGRVSLTDLEFSPESGAAGTAAKARPSS